MDLQLIDELSHLLGERFTTRDYERHQHGKDESSFRPIPPEAVCFPISTEEVATIIQLCQQYQTPPCGAKI